MAAMTRMKGYPRWFPAVLYGIVLVLFASGVLLVPTLLEMRLDWGVSWRLPNSQRTVVAVVHAGFAFGMMMLLGALMSVHMRIGWKQHRNRTTGSGLMVLLILLAMTSLGIYYVGDETGSILSSLVHTVLGVVLGLLLLLHRLMALQDHGH